MVITDPPGSDNGDAKGSVPSAPPPTYAEVAARSAQRQPSQPPPPVAVQRPPPTSYTQPHPHANTSAQPIPSSPPARAYGPTPLAAAQADTSSVLPYYDPRSPWAMEAGIRRARRRFFGALFWGILIWLAVGSLIGGAVDGGRRGGSWAVA